MQEVTAAILINAGKILIAKRKARDRQANKWEFPGGKIEPNETPEQCLKREMKEEFGIEVAVGKYLAESIYQYKHGAIKLLAYRTHWKNGNISLKEHSEISWVSLDQLSEYEFAPADISFVEKLQRKEITPS